MTLSPGHIAFHLPLGGPGAAASKHFKALSDMMSFSLTSLCGVGKESGTGKRKGLVHHRTVEQVGFLL
jgi:hypothetical protein